MNDIQTEVNFFEWFDKYYKPKILADRNTNTNSLLQREAIHRHRPLTNQNTIMIKDKTITHTPPNTLPLTKTYECDILNTNHNICKISLTVNFIAIQS